METKIILDANIWVSIFLGRSQNKFLDLTLDKNFLIIADFNLRNEVVDVITRKNLKKNFQQNILLIP